MVSPHHQTLEKPASALPFQDATLPVNERVEDLLGRLSLSEKIGQMMHNNPPVSRLGIPAYNWWNEACHGVGRAGSATVFPQVIGLAATWNRSLVQRVAQATATEAIAKHQDAARKELRGQYRGLTFWTPNVNIFRDPRWGRGQETFGEDPYLTAQLGCSMVLGLQGENPDRLQVAACAKHFAVHSGPESQRHSFDAIPSQKDLWETYLPAFEALVAAGVEAVMGAYNRTFGEACCASAYLIGDVLRDTWGFRGHYVSDCGAVDDFHLYHGVSQSPAESAALAIRQGCDLNCGCTYTHAVEAVEKGLLSEKDIDRSVRRLLATKTKLGLLDKESNREPVSLDVVESPAHRLLARESARQSMVLLKNRDATLPLPRQAERVLVVGPNAANIGALVGNYHGISANLVTMLQGIIEALPENTAVKYRPGCPILSPQAPGVNYTFDAADLSDYVIAVMGLDHTLEGEEGDTVASSSGGDRDRIEIPQVQLDFLKNLRPYCKKLVVVLTGGSAMAVPTIQELADAVLLAWYPGCEGGRAVADILFGQEVPTGRLPVTVPFATSDLPPFEDYSMRNRTYKFAEKEPLYPFGFGLSTADIEYVSCQSENASIAEHDEFSILAQIANRSNFEAVEIAQCYLIPPADFPDAPQAQLVGFERIVLPPQSTKELRFSLSAKDLRLVDPDGKRVFHPGVYQIVVGPSAPCQRAIDLGAPAPARLTLQFR